MPWSNSYTASRSETNRLLAVSDLNFKLQTRIPDAPHHALVLSSPWPLMLPMLLTNCDASCYLDFNPKPPLLPGPPSLSPTAPKNQLPSSSISSTATTAQSSSARPAPLRTQSYSKRHASFDTPREVPLPAMPSGQVRPALIPTFDDSERESEASWYQTQQRPSGSVRKSTGEPDLTAPIATPVGASQSTHEGYFPLLPQFSRNNSAPTPPHTSRVDLRPRKDPSPDFVNQSENSSPGQSAGSDDTTPAHESPFRAQSPMEGAAVDQKAENRGYEKGIHMVTSDSRLSSSSLPLPHVYNAERVTRLPPTTRHVAGTASSTHATTSEMSLAIPEGQAVQNLSSGAHGTSEPSSAMGHRSSFPLAASATLEVPLDSGLSSPLLPNTTPGTTFRFSASSLQRQVSVDDEEEREALQRGHTPKLPEIEAPKSVLHPLLATSPTKGTPSFATPPSGPRDPLPPSKSSPDKVSPRDSTTSPTMSIKTDRASTASGSSGVGSDYISFAHRASESSPTVQPGIRSQATISRLINQRSERDKSESSTSSSSALPGQTSQSLPENNTIQRDGTNGPVMTVDTTPSAYILQASLPGYQRDEITISTRKKRILHVVADGFVSGGGEF